jgi:3',5'-cyclic AMP phosphodiesterase CpdA
MDLRSGRGHEVGRRWSRGALGVALALAIPALGGAALARPTGSADVAAPTASAVVPAIAFAKGPYLQALGATGVTVKFELAAAGPARVEVFAAGGREPVASQASAEASVFHALRVDGLAPATAYDYRVGGEAGHFTTAPTDNRPFRFLLYGDSRTDPEAHAAVVRRMAGAPGDFLINTGDLVHSGANPSDWREFFAIESPLLRDRCVFAAVGNHELARGDAAGEVAFLRYFAPVDEGRELRRLYGTFRWSNTRFFLLNAMDKWTGDERAWLRAELEHARDEQGLAHRIAVLHWGPFSSGPHGGNPALESGEVTAMMRDLKVDLVLAGHDHAYERGEGDGIRYVISGGAGAPLYPRKFEAKQTIAYESTHHFVEVAVDGDRVTLTARRPSGGVIETCGFHGAPGWDCASPDPAAAPSPRVAPISRGSLGLVGGGAAVAVVAAVAAAAGLALRRRGQRDS